MILLTNYDLQFNEMTKENNYFNYSSLIYYVF